MRIIGWTTSHWNNAAEAVEKASGLFGLRAWEERMKHLFRPNHLFIACGTWSDPDFNTTTAAIVNAGVEPGEGYDIFYRQYWACAATAAMAYALNRKDWDFLVFLDTDCLVGAVNFPVLFSEFEKRPEIILSNRWCNTPSGPFFVLKRAGACMFLHERLRANIIRDNVITKPMLTEDELAIIFKGRWWDAWPDVDNVRQDFSVRPNIANPLESLHWPFIRQPHPDVIAPYISTQYSLAVPL